MIKRREIRRLSVPLLFNAIIRDIWCWYIVSVICLPQIASEGIVGQKYKVGLLIKVSTADEEIVVDDNEFISTVYSDSKYSVQKQLESCSSHRAPMLMPYRRNTTSGAEVVEVRLPGYSAAYNRTTIVSAAIDRVKYQLDVDDNVGLGEFVDFVVFCVPNELSGPAFLASGAYNSFWVIAKPPACTNPRILLHEFGHLFGLKHARQDEDEYGDATSVMGRTSNAQNRCFNGYNFWKLRWFNNDYTREIVTSLKSELPIKMSLATFVDASKLQSLQSQSVVLLKIDDYYLVYNRRKGFNNETGEFPDMVTVVQALDTEESEMVIGLNETEGNNIYRYTNNASQLIVIQACSRHRGNLTSADSIVVAIGMEDFPCRSEGNSISESKTEAPSGFPIVRPTPAPTQQFRSESPNLTVVMLPTLTIVTPAPNKVGMSNTPSISDMYTVQSSYPSSRIPIRVSESTVAPQLDRVPAALNPSDMPAPIVRQSNIGYTQSPFPPIRYYDQQQYDKKAKTGTRKHFFNHVVFNVAIATSLGLVLIGFVVLILRARKRRIAIQQSILPTEIQQTIDMSKKGAIADTRSHSR